MANVKTRERGTTFLLERLPPDLWARFRAKARADGHTMRWVILELVASYLASGLPTRKPKS